MGDKALIVVDVQRDFCEGGALAVPRGNYVAERINSFINNGMAVNGYGILVFTKDFHEPNSTNGGHIALPPESPDFVDTWPPHCLQGTEGVLLNPVLAAYEDHPHTFFKGDGVPAYSGFEGNSWATAQDGSGEALVDFLTRYKVDTVDVCGLAADYCVRATMDDAADLGFEVGLLTDLTAGIHKGGEEVWEEFAADALSKATGGAEA